MMSADHNKVEDKLVSPDCFQNPNRHEVVPKSECLNFMLGARIVTVRSRTIGLHLTFYCVTFHFYSDGSMF